MASFRWGSALADTIGVALALLVVLCALVIGRSRGGSFAQLSETELRWRSLVIIAVAAQLLGGIGAIAGSQTSYDIGLALSAAAVLGFCCFNVWIAGVALITLGLTLNAIVVVLNGAMPVSYQAAYHAGASVQAIAAGLDPRHELAGPGTTLRKLGDIVPVSLPGWRQVDSPGDLAIAAGLGEFVVIGMGSSIGRRRRDNIAKDGVSGKHRASQPAA